MNSEILKLKDCNKEELLQKTKENVKDNHKKYNSFVTILEDTKLNEETSSVLSNIPYALKDNISTKGILTTASSNTLKDYIPSYDATVYQKLKEAGAICIGKTVMDELGMGGTGTTGHTGIVKNPWDVTRIAGGSSSGSAVAVASGIVPFAIGTDTGDSVRKPAAYCGITGYKPTYGMISRYGVFAFASSLDTVGVLTNSVYDAALVVNEIKGKDANDMTTIDSSSMDLVKNIKNSISGKKLFYIREIASLDSYENPDEELKTTLTTFQDTIEKIKSLGVEVEEVSLDKSLLETIHSVYVCISCAEATSNMSNLTGLSFGVRGSGDNIDDIMIDHRTKGFSPLIKRRFVIGSYVLQRENQEKYFVNAQRIRGKLVRLLKEYFKEYDALILPCSKGGAPKIDSVYDKMTKRYDILENHMVLGNFGGFPSITIPNGMNNGLPIGINLMSDQKMDETLLNIAYQCEQVIDFKGGVSHE